MPLNITPNSSTEDSCGLNFLNNNKYVLNSNDNLKSSLKLHYCTKSAGNLPITGNNNNNNNYRSLIDLRKLHTRISKLQHGKYNVKKQPFFTTVKQGEFLEPPPEIATLIGLNLDHRYAYANRPKVLQHKSPPPILHQRKNSDGPPHYSNVMYEKRVYRGTNFRRTITAHLGDGEGAAARAAESRRRAIARHRARQPRLRLGSPPPVPGRKHEPIQTDQYLEELFDLPPVTDMCTQTDLFLDRPHSPLFVPVKSGVDVATQIYPGDLFDFDLEVQPILEVLVGKTVEQAMLEVLEEEELAALRIQQRRYLERRAVEAAEMQRLVEVEERIVNEKDRTVREHESGMKDQKEMDERITASVLMHGYIADVLPSVLEGLQAEGVLVENAKRDVDEGFIPWLMREVTGQLKGAVTSRDIVTDLIREIVENRIEMYNALNRGVVGYEAMGEEHDDRELKEHLKLTGDIRDDDN